MKQTLTKVPLMIGGMIALAILAVVPSASAASGLGIFNNHNNWQQDYGVNLTADVNVLSYEEWLPMTPVPMWSPSPPQSTPSHYWQQHQNDLLDVRIDADVLDDSLLDANIDANVGEQNYWQWNGYQNRGLLNLDLDLGLL